MATHHLLKLSRRSHRALSATRSTSTAASVASVSDTPAPAPPSEIEAQGRVAEQVQLKLKRLEDPDPRFLRYNSPYPTLTNHTSILTYPETRVTTLPNGLRVATESNLASHTATIAVWIDAGSRYETEETNGVAHFLEHMIFEGTSTRSGSDLDEEVENMGGHLNAGTSREHTVYMANVMSGDVPKALDILSDILQNSTFDENLINSERGVILNEMLEVRAQTQELVFDHMHATAFQRTPLGRTVIGPPKNIFKITKKDIQYYMSTHYAAHRMVISASGAVKHEEVVEQVKKMFTQLSTNPTTTTKLVEKEPAIFTGSEIRKRNDDMPLAHFSIAFKGASWTDPDAITLLVIQAMLGSWDKTTEVSIHMGSQLAHLVGIAESMMAVNSNYKDTGLFGVYAVAKPDCLDDLALAIMQGISKLCYRVNEDDVIRAQNQLKSSWVRHIEGTSLTADEIGRQLITYGRRIPYAELFARIDAVDAATIKHVSNRFIVNKDIAIAASGPVKLLPDYNWFRRRTSMLHY